MFLARKIFVVLLIMFLGFSWGYSLDEATTEDINPGNVIVVDDPKPPVRQGRISFGLGFGYYITDDDEVFSIGGNIGYFLTDFLQPGITFTAFFSQNDDIGDYYFPTAYLKLFLPVRGRFIPFLFGEIGYGFSDIVSAQVYRPGFGFLYFTRSNIALDLKAYYQITVFDSPDNIENYQGWDFNLGIAFFIM